MAKDLCPIHGSPSYDSSDIAESIATGINGRPGQRVKAFRSDRCGTWHVSQAGGSGARERRRQRRAAEREQA